MNNEDKTRLEQTGRSALESLMEMINCLHEAREDGMTEYEKGYPEDEDGMMEYIQQDPLEITTRQDWSRPGAEDVTPSEYNILLSTGGPASRIIGELDEYGQASTARLQVQDWGTPWTDVDTTTDQDDKLVEYANCFYYGG